MIPRAQCVFLDLIGGSELFERLLYKDTPSKVDALTVRHPNSEVSLHVVRSGFNKLLVTDVPCSVFCWTWVGRCHHAALSYVVGYARCEIPVSAAVKVGQL